MYIILPRLCYDRARVEAYSGGNDGREVLRRMVGKSQLSTAKLRRRRILQTSLMISYRQRPAPSLLRGSPKHSRCSPLLRAICVKSKPTVVCTASGERSTVELLS